MLQLLKAALLSLAAIAITTAVMAQDTRTQTVRFPRGASGTTIEASITSNQSVRYSIGVNAGQRMSVQLDTDNASSYFNVTAPGAREALFNGSISGNSTSVVIPSSGNYVIEVYLMRNAARRNETANYSLTLYVENAATAPVQRPQPSSPRPNPAPSRVDTSMMPRFCQGEASAKFGVRPQDLTTNMAFKSGNNYVVQGNFDGSDGTTFFNCWFALDGSFSYIN